MRQTHTQHHNWWLWGILTLCAVVYLLGMVALAIFAYPSRGWGQEPDAQAPSDVGLPADFVEDVGARGQARTVFRSGPRTVGIFSTRSEHYETTPGTWRRKKAHFRTDGADDVSDDNDVVVRLTNSPTRIQITDRAGNGVAFPLAARAVRTSDTTFTASVGAITLTYTLTTSGVKAAATISQRLGAQTWTLDYTLLGTATASILADGSLQIGVFTIPRPVAIGADGNRYAIASGWELRPASKVRVAMNDSSLPDPALPYVLDPTTTFDSTSANDTGMTGASTLPITTGSCGGFDPNVISLGWEHTGDNYSKRIALWKWDTSGIGAGASVTAAKLQIRLHDVNTAADSLSHVAE